jgi:photosystem II stability/assembly factor-like uncharacterized protein
MLINRYTLLLVVLCGSIFISCQKSESNRVLQSPEDNLYIQRAFPNGEINQENVIATRKHVKSILSNEDNIYKNNNPWKSEGPTNIGGRVTDIARHPLLSETFYIGCSVGGVFKTINGGQDWEPIFDNVASPSIGSIVTSKTNPNTLYVGTGEANASATSGAFIGSGVYRSDDGGNTWRSAGLELSNHIGRLVVSDTDADIVVAAATGKLYGKCNNRGVYKTTDGGENWEQLLFVSDSTACIDVAMHPFNPNIIYAAMWERTRAPWQRDYGGPSSGIYRTLDGGVTWIRLEEGLPNNQNSRGRMGISLCASDPDVIYLTMTDNEITNQFLGVYRSDNLGENWQNISSDLPSNTFSSFGWFFGNIRCNPTDTDEAYVLGLNAYKKRAGESDWNLLEDMHVDMHALEFAANDPNDILIGNDGGIYRSLDGGTNITFLGDIPITQFYNVEIDFQLPERLFGGTQDNNTVGTFTGNNDDYDRLIGGDGFHVNVDPNNSNIIYAESQFGNLRKSVNGGVSFSSALVGVDADDRNNWNTPVILSPLNSNRLYYGTQRLYRSTNRAGSWTAISDDLTLGLHPSGAISFGTLTTIAPSHSDPNVIYTGSDDGTVSITRDGGMTWQNINPSIPQRYVTKISVNPEADNEAIITFSGYRYLDYVPHVMITKDYGQSWTDISSNLPEFPVNDIEYHPFDSDILYLATDMGVWTSNNEGLQWQVLGTELINTIVNDIKIHEPTNMMIAGTFGRSIFSLQLDAVSSTNEIATDNYFKLYPNPVARGSIVNIETDLSDFNIEIFDSKGSQVAGYVDQYTFTIDIPAGTYTVILSKDGNRSSRKLIVI